MNVTNRHPSIAVNVQARRKRWPDAIKLIERDERQALRDHERCQEEVALAEERLRIREGTRQIDQQQLHALLEQGTILGRLPCEAQPWSRWILPDESREFAVRITSAVRDEPAFTRITDLRGVEVGLFENTTLRLDHFVEWEEFASNYERWSVEGLGDLVLAPADVVETGEVPPQPGGSTSVVLSALSREPDLHVATAAATHVNTPPPMLTSPTSSTTTTGGLTAMYPTVPAGPTPMGMLTMGKLTAMAPTSPPIAVPAITPVAAPAATPSAPAATPSAPTTTP